MKYILLIFSLLYIASTAHAKEVKVIIPYSAGGPTDRVARIVIKHLNGGPYKFVPEYKLGAGGAVAANFVASVKDDTVLMVTSNALVSSPLLTPTSNYDLEKDFILLDYLGTEPLLVVVNTNSKIKNFKDFMQEGKTNFMPYGSAGVGTSGHLGSLIVSQNNPNYQHIPYKGSAGIIVDLLNNQLRWILDSELNVGTFIADNRVQPIAVYSRKRLLSRPEILTIKELGIKDPELYRWHILLSNALSDPEIIKYVTSKMQESALREELLKLGLDPEKPKMQNFFLNETAKTKRLIKDFKIQ
jgi:tripartite-type tricarboxylate transporter receptor subunit TctC